MVRITLAGHVPRDRRRDPLLISSRFHGLDQNLVYFMGGTSILIVVGVALDMVEKLNGMLIMRNYEGFMKKPVRRLQVGGGALNCDGPALFPTRQPTPEGRHGRDPRRVPRRSGRGQGDPGAAPRRELRDGARVDGRHAPLHVSDGTELGRQAKVFMESGRLVPDDLILAMVGERVRQPDVAHAWILDGFPRPLPQAKALDSLLQGRTDASAPASASQGRGLSHVIFFAVPEVLVRRLSGRQTCSRCGAIWNTYTTDPCPGCL